MAELERILAQFVHSGRRHPGDLLLQKNFVCEYFRNRTPDSGCGEVGETAPPAFAANDGPETTWRTVGVYRFLERN